MILDTFDNYKRYLNTSKRLRRAFEFIVKTDFNKVESGKLTIDGDDIFALIQEYDTKERDASKLESHFKYIDIQFPIKGSELMGVASLTNQVPVTVNIADDYAFYNADSSFIRVDEGMFVVFFPNDLHMPCIKLDTVSRVKKVVVKVRV